ncbi:MAG: lytic transglycosylase domain-containing protein [Bacteroidia bacterium]|nr:MAG: lytic transglycosylase domain-containing protein [Bacteroidia bacterium]
MLKTNIKSVAFGFVLICLIISVFVINQSFKSFARTYESGSSGDSLIFNKPYKLPENVTFAGEKMPLDNFDTRESLDREILTSAYRHSSTIMIIKRANRYLPVIEKILKENNIPDDFKYLVAAESEYSNVISPSGATGFWQIMASTGREEGMEINNVVDERYHLEKSTEFACRYFQKSYEKYGNWTLAAASYNGGRAAIDEQIRIQKENNYYDLLLAEETARYIFRAVAYKMVISNPKNFGFEIDKNDLYPVLDYYEAKVDTAISDFSVFAKRYGTNYKILKFLNPWLRKPYLTPKPYKEYLIKIPSEGMRTSEINETVN